MCTVCQVVILLIEFSGQFSWDYVHYTGVGTEASVRGSNWAEITQPTSGSAATESQFIRF